MRKVPGTNAMRCLMIFALAFCICTSCIPLHNVALHKEKGALQEPAWEKGLFCDPLTMQWKFHQGTRARYHERQKSFISTEETTSEQVHSITLTYSVQTVSADGIAQVMVTGKDLATEGKGFEVLQFLLRSSPFLGRFSIKPSGEMTEVEGLIDMRSLPLFPEYPVRVGTRWSGFAALAFAPGLPEAILPGTCTYQLNSIAEVEGHIWAKIIFEGTFVLPKKEISIKRVIGVQGGPPSDEMGNEVVVQEIVPGSPAEKAGITPGDIIEGIGGMDITEWSDVAHAISLSSFEKPTQVMVVRGQERKGLMLLPQTTLSGYLEAEGTIRGELVFDVTQGILIRMHIHPFTIDSSVGMGDQVTRIDARIESMIQFQDIQ